MRRSALTAVLLLGLECSPTYLDTVAPSDADFGLSCVPSCGVEGGDDGIILEVSFSGGARQYALCCSEREELRAWLTTIEDMWCDGLPVPEQKVGDLTVGTTVSEVTGKRGATIDDGEGYVVFNCGAWLPKLTAALGQSSCCGGRPPPGLQAGAPPRHGIDG